MSTENPIDKIKRFRAQDIVPSNVVIAVDKPLQIGQVLLLGGHRFAVERPLDRAEFDSQMAANQRHRHGAQSFISEFKGAKADPDSAALAAAPDSDQNYFYAMRGPL